MEKTNITKPTKIYEYARQKDIQRIKHLWNKTHQVEFSNSDNWVVVGGKTFNGFSKQLFEETVGIIKPVEEAKPIVQEKKKPKIEVPLINKLNKVNLIEEIMKLEPNFAKSRLWNSNISELRSILKNLGQWKTSKD